MTKCNEVWLYVYKHSSKTVFFDIYFLFLKITNP
nr:MAG TPA: hypothetical protein [Bacteriophage sp.]